MAARSSTTTRPSSRFRAGAERLVDLINEVVGAHHVFARTELARLSALAESVAHAHGERHPELVALSDLLAQLAADLVPHMDKEERVLFPYIVALENELDGVARHRSLVSARAPIAMVLREHERTLIVLRAIRTVAGDLRLPPDADDDYRALFDGIGALESDLVKHMQIEADEIFPRTLSLEDSLRS